VDRRHSRSYSIGWSSLNAWDPSASSRTARHDARGSIWATLSAARQLHNSALRIPGARQPSMWTALCTQRHSGWHPQAVHVSPERPRRFFVPTRRPVRSRPISSRFMIVCLRMEGCASPIRGANHFTFSDDGALLKEPYRTGVLHLFGRLGYRRTSPACRYDVLLAQLFSDAYLRRKCASPPKIASPLYPEIQVSSEALLVGDCPASRRTSEAYRPARSQFPDCRRSAQNLRVPI